MMLPQMMLAPPQGMLSQGAMLQQQAQMNGSYGGAHYYAQGAVNGNFPGGGGMLPPHMGGMPLQQQQMFVYMEQVKQARAHRCASPLLPRRTRKWRRHPRASHLACVLAWILAFIYMHMPWQLLCIRPRC